MASKLSKRRKCLIVIGGMYNSLIVIGIGFSINTLYLELIDVFQTTRKETSFVQTTLIGVTFASGVIAGIVVRHVGIKISLLIGAVMSSMGFFLSWFATSIPYLIATLGIISGLGNSLVNVATVVFIAITFKEKLGFPLSLLKVGSSLGQILLPLLLERMLETYGWRGSLLITSGLVLNVIVSCLLTTSSLGAGIPFKLPKTENTGGESSRKGRWQDLLNVTFMVHVFTAGICIAALGNIVVLFMDFLDSQGQTLQTSVNIFMGFSVMSLLARLVAGALSVCKRIRTLLLFWSFSLLSGWIFDTTGSYSLAFDICGYIAIGSALINVVVCCVQMFMKNRRSGIQDEEENKTSY